MTGEEVEVRIRAVYLASRGPLPRIQKVSSRPNVRRLAGLARRRDGTVVLNLSTAVVDAGPEAWALVAPALRGEAPARRRLRVLVAGGLERNRAQRSTGVRTRLRCDGTAEQRRWLVEFVDRVRRRSGYAHALPEDVQLRISRAMTSTLGSCMYRGGVRRITISARLFRTGLEDILEETVRHELAHLADQATSAQGRTSHGPAWREWAVRLGARPERLCRPDEADRIRASAAGRRARASL